MREIDRQVIQISIVTKSWKFFPEDKKLKTLGERNMHAVAGCTLTDDINSKGKNVDSDQAVVLQLPEGAAKILY